MINTPLSERTAAASAMEEAYKKMVRMEAWRRLAYKLISLADAMWLDFETVADFDEDYVPAWKRMAKWMLLKHRAMEAMENVETVVVLRLLRTHSATTEVMQTAAVPAHEAVSVPEAVPVATVRNDHYSPLNGVVGLRLRSS